MPLESAEFAIDADGEVVLLAHGDLGRVEDALRAVVEAEEDIAVVIQRAALNEGGEVGGEFLDVETGDELREVFGMGADVAEATGCAGFGRIGAPGSLLLAGFLEASGEPALRVFHDDLADFSELAGVHHVTGFFDERVAGVVVGETVEEACLFHERAEFLRLREIKGRGFVREDRESVFQRGFGSGEVDMVRSDDGDEVHTLAERQSSFGFHHFLEIAVASLRREEEIGTGVARALRVAAECAADEFDLPVESRRHAVDASDEGAASATDHAHADFAFCGAHWDLPFFLSKAASKATALEEKSRSRTNAAASVAPWMRSMRMSSHSTESGPW